MEQTSEVPPSILIERGSYVTRCGYVGEDLPIWTYKTPSISIEAQFRKIFEEKLKVDPAQCEVVIVKDAGTVQQILRDEAHLLFEKFRVKACAFVNAQVGILFSWVNKGSNGLIIDIGYDCTLIVPIIEFMPQMDFIAELTIAGRVIEQFIINNLLKHGISREIIEQYNEQLFPYLMKGYFFFDSESEQDFERDAITTRKENLPNYLYLENNDGKSIKISLPSPILPPRLINEKSSANNSSFSEEINSHILKIFEKFGIDNLGSNIEYDEGSYTSFWVGRIIMTGGAGNILGLRSFLIRELLKTSEFKRSIGCNRAPSSQLIDVEFRNVAFTIRNIPSEHEHSTWLGASIISSLKLFKKIFVSNETYQENPDIFFYLDNKETWTSLFE